MQRIDKAFVIGRAILHLKDRNWAFLHEQGMPTALVAQDGWRAMVWSRVSGKASRTTPGINRSKFLDKCRQLQCAYVFDLWLDGVGKVLSAEYDGTQFKLINFKRGAWETDYFGLPSRERPVSAGNMTVH